MVIEVLERESKNFLNSHLNYWMESVNLLPENERMVQLLKMTVKLTQWLKYMSSKVYVNSYLH